MLALAPRLTEGVARWRDKAAVREAVIGWLTDSLESSEDPARAVFVAEDAGEVIGVVTVGEQSHFTGEVDGYVGELAVAAHAEGQGVGRALMGAAETWAARRGHCRLVLETGAGNTAARAFYRALGYDEEDVRLSRAVGK